MEERNHSDDEYGARRAMPSRALIAVVLLVLAAAAGLRILGRAPIDEALIGSWVGYTTSGEHVAYFFGADGTGFRSVADVRDSFRYDLRPGYPVLLRLHVVAGADTVTYHGLLRTSARNRVQLELAPPGRPAPAQLGADALRLRRPASR